VFQAKIAFTGVRGGIDANFRISLAVGLYGIEGDKLFANAIKMIFRL
jgi:hypothetical protein